MSAPMTDHETAALAEIREAMKGDWRLESAVTFTHGTAVRVFARKAGAKSYRKVGPLLFPPDDGTVADVLAMLGAMATES